jgi:hypothetical protein
MTENDAFEPSEVDEETFLRVLAEARDALAGAGIDAVVMGGIASSALGRDRWTHDIDFFVRPEDKDRALAALTDAGFKTQETYPDWLYKGFKDETLVDVIFCASGEVFLDDEMVARAPVRSFGGLELRVLAPEDLLIIKAVVFKERTPRHWFDALALIEECELDWGYVLRRSAGREHRVLSLLVFAEGEGLPVPEAVARQLVDRVYAPAAHDEYVVGRLQDALAQDPRTQELGVDATVDGDVVVLSGSVGSAEQRAAVLTVAREMLHGRALREELEVIDLHDPEPAEELS